MAPASKSRKAKKSTTSQPSSSSTAVADKPCHNCRRRRLRCDRTVPHCSKCTSKDIECLGYGQLFQWTGAVASRGKLAGQKSSAALYPQVRSTARLRASISSASSASSSSPPPSSSSPSFSSLSVPPSSPAVSFPTRSWTEVTDIPQVPEAEPDLGLVVDDDECDDEYIEHDDHTSPVASCGTQLVCITGDPMEPPTPWVLVDPLFQDITSSHRQYLAYFDSRLCRDFVSYDELERNPFRNLLKLTQTHPLLRQVIIAASATHMFNRARPWLAAESLDRGEGPRNLLMDGLQAKHQVLRMLPSALQSLQNINSIDGDVILAVVLLLINVELIESGKHNWKAHFDGAGRIMKYLRPTSCLDESLRDYIMSDCFVYYILESTFRPSASDNQSFFQSYQALAVLGKTTNSYYCCPPELLEILLTASRLSSMGHEVVSADMVTAAGAALLDRAQNFDVLPWVEQAPSVPFAHEDPVLSRFRVASAHRLATCLYILHAVPSMHTWVSDQVADTLLEELYHTLCSIPDDDTNFKATAWITFIFGASVKTPEMKQWVTARIKLLMLESPWGFLYAARDALQMLWSLDDEGRRTTSWVQTLRDMHVDFLVV